MGTKQDLSKFKIYLALFQSGKVKRCVCAWRGKAQEDISPRLHSFNVQVAVLITFTIFLPGSCTLGQGSGNVLDTGMHSVYVHSADCQRTCKHERRTERMNETASQH